MQGRPVLFNGDFVDRGSHSAEVVASLLLLKAAYPNAVYLLRGNHEDGSLATVYGMRDEVRAKVEVRGRRFRVLGGRPDVPDAVPVRVARARRRSRARGPLARGGLVGRCRSGGQVREHDRAAQPLERVEDLPRGRER